LIPATNLQEIEESEIQEEILHALFDMRTEDETSTEEIPIPNKCTTTDPVEALVPLTADTAAVSYDCCSPNPEDRILAVIMTCKLDREPLSLFVTMAESEIQTLLEEADNPVLNLLQ